MNRFKNLIFAISLAIFLSSLYSCSYFSERQFNSCFKEVFPDTAALHVYVLDDYVGEVTDRAFAGEQISNKLISKYKIGNTNAGQEYYGTYRINLNDNASAYIIKIQGEGTNKIQMYVLNKKMEQIQILKIAELRRTKKSDHDRNAWIFDYNGDGMPDILFRIYDYDYTAMEKYLIALNAGKNPPEPEFENDIFRLMLWDNGSFKEKDLQKSEQNKLKSLYEMKFLKIFKGYRNKYY